MTTLTQPEPVGEHARAYLAEVSQTQVDRLPPSAMQREIRHGPQHRPARPPGDGAGVDPLRLHLGQALAGQ